MRLLVLMRVAVPREVLWPLRVEVEELEREVDEELSVLRVEGVAVTLPLRVEEEREVLLPRLGLFEELEEVRVVADELRVLLEGLALLRLEDEEDLLLSSRLVEPTLLRDEELLLRVEGVSVLLPLRWLVTPESLPLREVLLPLRVVVFPLREVLPSPRVVSVLSRVPRPLSDSVRLGALTVEPLPVTRSVVVTVLLLRSLVMRLPLRPVGLFCTVVADRGAVTRPTRGRLSYW